MAAMEVSGSAQICFSKDRLWFQGQIITDDDCQFTINGIRCENASEIITDESDEMYKMCLHDHEQFLSYTLQNVKKTRKQMNISLDSTQVHFESQKQYRGQRADIMIQCVLPDLVGRDLDLFVGKIKIVYDEKQTRLIPYPTWSC